MIWYIVLLGFFVLLFIMGGDSAPCDDLCGPDLF
jgi:hypothetical protein